MTQAQISSSWDGKRWVDSPDARRDRMVSMLANLDALRAARHLLQQVTSGPCDTAAIGLEVQANADIEKATNAILDEVRGMLAERTARAA